jgi:hypothetical protein
MGGLIAGDASAWTQAVKDFVGYAEVKTGTNGVRYISRTTPHPFPLLLVDLDADGEPWLYATGFPTVEGMAFVRKNQGVAEYKLQKMVLGYDALTYNIREDDNEFVRNQIIGSSFQGYPDEGYAASLGFKYSRYVTHTREPGSKFMSLARGLMYVVGDYLSDGVKRPLPEGLPFKEPFADVQIVWHNVPEDGVPNALHMVCHGCINAEAFMGYPAETLRIEGIKPIAKRDPVGNRVFDVIYKMQFLPRVGRHLVPGPRTLSSFQTHGHNWVYCSDKAAASLIVAPVTSDGTLAGTAPYQTMDFKLLFNPDQTP